MKKGKIILFCFLLTFCSSFKLFAQCGVHPKVNCYLDNAGYGYLKSQLIFNSSGTIIDSGWTIYKSQWILNDTIKTISSGPVIPTWGDPITMGYNKVTLGVWACRTSTGDSCYSEGGNIFQSMAGNYFLSLDYSLSGLTLGYGISVTGAFNNPPTGYYRVSFGDGTFETTTTGAGVHTYPGPGTYCMSFNAKRDSLGNNSFQGWNSFTREIYIDPTLPDIGFQLITFYPGIQNCNSIYIEAPNFVNSPYSSIGYSFNTNYVWSVLGTNFYNVPMSPPNSFLCSDIPVPGHIIVQHSISEGYTPTTYCYTNSDKIYEFTNKYIQACDANLPDTLFGFVYFDSNGNSIKDSNEVGIPNIKVVPELVQIFPYAVSDMYTNYFALTDSNGRYSVPIPNTSIKLLLRDLPINYKSTFGNGYYNVVGTHNPHNRNYNFPVDTLNTIISGITFLDLNNDSLFNLGDIAANNIVVKATNVITGEQYSQITSNGNYNFNLISGIYKINAFSSNPYFTIYPDSIIINSTGGNFSQKNFSITSSLINDASVSMGGFIARPGFNSTVPVNLSNNGLDTAKVTLTIQFDSLLNLISVLPNTGIVDTVLYTVTWDSIIIPINANRSFSIVTNLPATVPVGTFLTFDASINPDSGFADTLISNNHSSRLVQVVGSFDPNDKSSWCNNDNKFGFITKDERLYYRINFQNVGTFYAENIIVEDLIDPSLDISTFEMIRSSHPYKILINENNISWKFPGINLIDSTTNESLSHGFIEFSIKPIASINNATYINNKAKVFFDFNQPLETNVVSNLYINCDSIKLCEIYRTICEGTFYNFNGQNINTEGIFLDTLLTNGCDSVEILNLKVIPTNFYFDLNLCDQDSLYWEGRYIYLSGNYIDSLNNQLGCDSIIHLDLNFSKSSPITNLQVAICSGEIYDFNGRNLSLAGFYTDTLANSSGCDSIVQLNLIVNQKYLTNFSDSICSNGGTYIYNGIVYSAPGTYQQTFTSINGCDSVINLKLSYFRSVYGSIFTNNLSLTLCDNDSIYFNGEYISSPGLYIDTLSRIYTGCDSIVNLQLSRSSSKFEYVDRTICNGTSYNFGGELLDQAGLYYDTLQTSVGCDSIVELNLQINYNTNLDTILFINICQGETYTLGNSILSSPGVYTDTLNYTGCDSIVTVNLTVNPKYNLVKYIVICENRSYDFNGQILTLPGVYYDTLSTIFGCDSIVMLRLFVSNADTSVSQNQNTLLANALNANYQWLDCNSGLIIPGANSQTFTPNSSGSYAVILDFNGICIDTSNCNYVSLTSINELYISSYFVEPNPFKDELRIFIEKMDGANLEIFSLIGQKVFTEKIYPNSLLTLDTKTWASGIYFVKIHTINKELVKKIIKE